MARNIGFPKLKGSSGASETASSIKQKYESNTNTNAFTDAEKSKLNGLENTINQKDSSELLFWVGTQAEYDLLAIKAENTIYYVL